MDNVKKVEKALDQITKLSDQGYSVLTEAEKREPIKFKLDPKSLVYAKWEKIDPFDARNYQVSNNAFIAGNVSVTPVVAVNLRIFPLSANAKFLLAVSVLKFETKPLNFEVATLPPVKLPDINNEPTLGLLYTRTKPEVKLEYNGVKLPPLS